MDFDASMLRGQIGSSTRNSKWKKLVSKLKEISITTYILFILFGIGAWTATNGILSESRVLVTILPECHKLMSYVMIIFQVANIGPILYLTIKGVIKVTCKRTDFIDIIAMYCILSLALVASIVLAIFWGRIVTIGSTNVSLSFFVIIAFLALSDSTGTILFLPFLSSYPEIYVSALYVGEGLSGLLPNLWAAIQGNPPIIRNCSDLQATIANIAFGPGVYFALLIIISFTSIAGFILIHILPAPQREKYIVDLYRMTNLTLSNGQNRHFTYRPPAKPKSIGWCGFNNISSNEWNANSIESCESYHHQLESLKEVGSPKKEKENKTGWLAIYLILTFIIYAFSNSLLLVSLPYYTVPYGSITLPFTIILYYTAIIVSSLFPVLMNTDNKSLIPVLTSIHVAISIWLLCIAGWSENPPLKNSGIGGLHVVLLSILNGCIVGYVKVYIGTYTRTRGGEYYLFLVGLVSQFGTLVGYLVSFIVIFVTK